MANRINRITIAAAVAAALGLGLSSSAGAVVVVGGDNGWEVSFDGNINAFYVHSHNKEGYNALGYTSPTGNQSFAGTNNGEDISRVQSGFLPAFFSFNVKSPTVNGMTATGRFSFAPTIQSGATKNQIYAGGQGIQGASIDTREVVVNVDGPWGTVSFGRTLSIYGRQAILNDMTLFGVGEANARGATVTAGRIGRGYTYPNFDARFSYKTPVLGGFQAEMGLYDPSIEENGINNQGGAVLNQTRTPRVEGELTYTARIGDATFKGWFDGLWQQLETSGKSVMESTEVAGWGTGATAGYMGFNVTGYYYQGNGLGRSLQFVGGAACDAIGAVKAGTTGRCESAENRGYYVQGSYTFLGTTKLGVSYGESQQDKFKIASVGLNALSNQDLRLSMWTVGVYHDVNSWLKLIAEYSKSENEYQANAAQAGTFKGKTDSNTISVGTFFVW